MKNFVFGALCALAVTVTAETTFADSTAPTHQVVNATSRGIAMDGFDPVAYFIDGQPAKGSMDHRTEFRDRLWLFSSAENLEQFQANPEAYAPQNNGWCAWAVAHGYAAEVDFVNGWFIENDKLYVVWNEDVKNRFLAKKDELIPLAEANWTQVHSGLLDGSTEFYPHAIKPELGLSHPQTLPEEG
ncbi:YHS domain-containing (seleno)protein [Ruegeria sp.]|uniref:YHS domain-containing (seleno)protein n=1 Tax=Ruegeria sp. TaxID=1879320 RepID=UPI00231DC8A9|nr:YHS domain-containing (seleno)protein [Ruegeria sp.]MDA7963904.1 hypothetical protein [Ruegeria sp.]